MRKLQDDILSHCFGEMKLPIDNWDKLHGAQVYKGKWYFPKWGCDTLEHILDIVEGAKLNDNETDLLFTTLEEKSGDWDIDEGDNSLKNLILKLKQGMGI